MKKTLIIIAVVVLVLYLFNSIVVSWFEGKADEVAVEMDPLESLSEICSDKRSCLAAIEQYGRSCVNDNGPEVVGLETYLEHVANVMVCVNDRSGTEHFPTESD
ncbi:MAG: hypothetical protein AAGJ52_10890 [Pseudomonadota bacterium]